MKSKSFKQIISNKYLLNILLYMSQLFILTILLFQEKIVFTACDDTVMVAIAGGGYGHPSEYIINMHIFIGYILKFLFWAFKNINWITVFYLLVIIISFININRIFINKIFKHPYLFLGYFCLIDITYTIILTHFTFTVIAYTASITSSLNLLSWLDKKEKGYLIRGILFMLLAACIRSDVMITVCTVFFFVSIYEIIINKHFTFSIVEFLAFGLMLLSTTSNAFMNNLNSTQNEFLKWGELRSQALDCAAVPYDKKQFEAVGISEAQYYALYNTFYYNKDAVSEEVLEKLITLNDINNKYDFNVISYFQRHFSYLNEKLNFFNLFRWIFSILFISNMILGTSRTKMHSFLIYLGTVCTEFIYYFIQRPFSRVMMPTFLLAIFIFLYIGRYNYQSKLLNFLRNRVLYKRIYILFVSLISIISFYTLSCYFNELKSAINFSDERKKVLEYANSHSGSLLLAADSTVLQIGLSDSIWRFPNEQNKWNLIGNWEIYSVPSNTLVRSYGYDDFNNIFKYSLNSQNIYIMTSQADTFLENSGKYIIDLYEQYYGKRPNYQLVDDIHKISLPEQGINEHWATFRLID